MDQKKWTQTKAVAKGVIDVYKKHATNDRDHNLEIVAAMLSASMASLALNANTEDCAGILTRAMKEIGWTK